MIFSAPAVPRKQRIVDDRFRLSHHFHRRLTRPSTALDGVNDAVLYRREARSIANDNSLKIGSIYCDRQQPDGTSIEIVISLSKNAEDNKIYKLIGPRAHAIYKDQAATQKSSEQIKYLAVKPKNF